MKTAVFFIFLFSSCMLNAQTMNMETSAVKFPLSVKSNEATKDQLAFAKAEGDSVNNCITWILNAAKGMSGEINAGEYKITYAITAAEGWYNYVDHDAQWQKPSEDATAHLWVFVQDGTDKRIVPDLNIKANFLKDSSIVESVPVIFSWMPLINGYGNNINLSNNGNYTLQIQIQPPSFHRHDPYNGDRFTKIAAANFSVSFNKENIPAEKLSDLMEQQTALSQGAGNAFLNTLKEMYSQATDGKDTIAGDYFIAVADEYSEGYWYYGRNNKFTYKMENEQSAETNAHIEVAVLDAKTKRFMHNLNVTVTIYKNDKEIGSAMEHFMWHPWLYHYGDNWRVPSPGKDYRIHVHADPPVYRRYGKMYGRQFTQPADVDFYNIEIKTGQK